LFFAAVMLFPSVPLNVFPKLFRIFIVSPAPFAGTGKQWAREVILFLERSFTGI